MRWIYLSPHFDDAVFSCGGWIWEQAHAGTPVEIWTICAGDPPDGPLSREARHCHRVWGTGTAQETVALRRLEDQAANQAIRAAWRHLTLPDCIYRLSPRGEPLYPEAVNVSPHVLEFGLDQAIAAEIQAGLEIEDQVICPLAIGGHVDHRLTRAAAAHLGRPIWYYADLPYLFRHPSALSPVVEGMRSALHPISPRGLAIWMGGIAAHASQILMQFTSEADMQATMRLYWKAHGGLRLWGEA
jgi:LmbE family N-acetylglucosaminyl deacetylase